MRGKNKKHVPEIGGKMRQELLPIWHCKASYATGTNEVGSWIFKSAETLVEEECVWYNLVLAV